ncbi:MAG: hypothetical protein ACFE8P_16430 [Promethearchaeota archaeon]
MYPFFYDDRVITFSLFYFMILIQMGIPGFTVIVGVLQLKNILQGN